MSGLREGCGLVASSGFEPIRSSIASGMTSVSELRRASSGPATPKPSSTDSAASLIPSSPGPLASLSSAPPLASGEFASKGSDTRCSSMKSVTPSPSESV